jgi:hypothetical protein
LARDEEMLHWGQKSTFRPYGRGEFFKRTEYSLFGGVARSSASFTVQIDQRPKPLWFAANDGSHQPKPERAGANK